MKEESFVHVHELISSFASSVTRHFRFSFGNLLLKTRMGSNNRWNWEVAGFEPRKSVEQRDDYRRVPVAPRRYSMSISSQADLAKQVVNSKFLRLNDKVKVSVFAHQILRLSDAEKSEIFSSVFMRKCF